MTATKPTSRGWRGPGAGPSNYLAAPEEWRATSRQVCGLWPFAAGSGSPMIGVPVGRNLLTGGTLCMDPISWFMPGKLISNPSAFVLGLPGLGKSSLIRHMLLGLMGYGVTPIVLGDKKPDYVDLIEAADGQVIRVGRGRGHLNVLDQSIIEAAAPRRSPSRTPAACAASARPSPAPTPSPAERVIAASPDASTARSPAARTPASVPSPTRAPPPRAAAPRRCPPGRPPPAATTAGAWRLPATPSRWPRAGR